MTIKGHNAQDVCVPWLADMCGALRIADITDLLLLPFACVNLDSAQQEAECWKHTAAPVSFVSPTVPSRLLVTRMSDLHCLPFDAFFKLVFDLLFPWLTFGVRARRSERRSFCRSCLCCCRAC